jgi:hypothetical protein
MFLAGPLPLVRAVRLKMSPVIGIYILTVFGVTPGAGVDVLNAFPRKASAVV